MAARKTFHGYAAPLLLRPEWTAAYLVFKGGAPDLRAGSLTGGGQIYGHEYQGLPAPVIVNYAPGVNAIGGGGQIPSLPAYLAPLFGGAAGRGS